MSKKEKKTECVDYSPALLAALKKFFIRPNVDISKKQEKILMAIQEMAEPDFYDLLDWFDMRPSKLDMHLYELEDQGLITIEDETGIIRLTETGECWAEGPFYKKKDEKKFRSFLESLSDDELKDFCELCDTIEEDGELSPESDEDEEDEDDEEEDDEKDEEEDGRKEESEPEKAPEEASVKEAGEAAPKKGTQKKTAQKKTKKKTEG